MTSLAIDWGHRRQSASGSADENTKVIWEVVRAAAANAGIGKLAPHDLRRTCARLCHLACGALEQIQFLLGHVSIQYIEYSEALSVTGIEMGSGALFLTAVSPFLPPMEGMLELPRRHER